MTLATIRRRLFVLVTPRQQAADVLPPMPPPRPPSASASSVAAGQSAVPAPADAILDEGRTSWAAEMASPSFMILAARLR
ncbi:hypothetical protein [Streptomyces sp. NPDC023588]|uniref:hypothetical protein n=1 Tax=Streptomyces sp. NPDC023588 TaxID=3154907 RepID=UPI0033F84E97